MSLRHVPMNRRATLWAILVVAGVLLAPTAFVWAAESRQFSDFPAKETHNGAPAQIDEKSAPEQWSAIPPQFLGIIQEDITKGPNFAGAYHLTTVPCGSGCEAIFVIDLRNGRVRAAPEAASNGVLFQRDSRLVILKENRTYGMPRIDLVFENGTFRKVE